MTKNLDKTEIYAHFDEVDFQLERKPEKAESDLEARSVAQYYFQLATVYESRTRRHRGSMGWRIQIALSRLANSILFRKSPPLYTAEEYIKSARQRAAKAAKKNRDVSLEAIPLPPSVSQFSLASIDSVPEGTGNNPASGVFAGLCKLPTQDLYRTVRSYINREDIVFLSRFQKWADANPALVTQRLRSVLALGEISVGSRNGLYSLVVKKCKDYLHRYEARGFVTHQMWQDYFDLYANALSRIGRQAEAVNILDNGISKLGRPPALVRRKALILTWAGESKAALGELARIEGDTASFTPRDQILKAFLLDMQGDNELAAFELERALLRSNCPADAHLLASNVALKQGNMTAGKTSVDKCFASYALRSVATHAGRPLTLPAIMNQRPARNAWGPLVTVIMTAYRAHSTIRFAVESVLAQSHPNLELIAVEDNGGDSTLELLKSLARTDDRIKVVANAENIGTYRSKNSVLGDARGQYVTFHDSDDWWHPDHIQEHLKLMASRPELVVSTSRWARIDEEGQFILSRSGLVLHHNPASMFVRKEVFAKIGGFDANTTGADSEFMQRIRTVFGTASAGAIQKPLAFGLHRPDSLTQSGNAGYDENRYSSVRETYRARWLEWQRQGAGVQGKLHIPFEESASRFSN